LYDNKKLQRLQITARTARGDKSVTHEKMHRMLVPAKAEGLFEPFFLHLSTGLRRGEWLGLQGDDMDFILNRIPSQ